MVAGRCQRERSVETAILRGSAAVSFSMKSFRAMRALVVLAALAALAGCNGLYNYYNNGGTDTLSGTLTLTGLGATGYAYVTATLMSYPYSTSVLEPSGPSGTQTSDLPVVTGGLPTRGP